MTNRNPIKQVFITFPQSTGIDKHSFRDKLLRFEPDFYHIVEEHHKVKNSTLMTTSELMYRPLGRSSMLLSIYRKRIKIR